MADTSCFLCGDPFQDIKKLKFHLVLVHPKSHVCLFCLEKKGWSDEFPTQVGQKMEKPYTKPGGIQRALQKVAFRSDRGEGSGKTEEEAEAEAGKGRKTSPGKVFNEDETE